jgi:hypothetical protein
MTIGSSDCPGSGQMRRRGFADAEGLEILFWGFAAKGIMGSVVVEPVSEGVDEGLQFVDAVRQVVACVELVAPAYPFAEGRLDGR